MYFDDYTQEELTSLSSILTKYMKMLENTQYKDLSSYLSILGDTFMQAPNNEDFILSQYDIVSDASKSKVATEADEIMIVIDKNDKLTDLLFCHLNRHILYSYQFHWF